MTDIIADTRDQCKGALLLNMRSTCISECVSTDVSCVCLTQIEQPFNTIQYTKFKMNEGISGEGMKKLSYQLFGGTLNTFY